MSSEAKFPSIEECTMKNGVKICKADMGRHPTLLATFGSDSASYTTTAPAFRGAERQDSRGNCVFDENGRAVCN